MNRVQPWNGCRIHRLARAIGRAAAGYPARTPHRCTCTLHYSKSVLMSKDSLRGYSKLSIILIAYL